MDASSKIVRHEFSNGKPHKHARECNPDELTRSRKEEEKIDHSGSSHMSHGVTRGATYPAAPCWAAHQLFVLSLLILQKKYFLFHSFFLYFHPFCFSNIIITKTSLYLIFMFFIYF